MIKLFISLALFFSVNTQAATTRVLLHYELGNQITRSEVTVLSNGLVMLSESHIGRAVYLEDKQLTASELKALLENIEKASLEPQIRNDEIPATMGGAYGELEVSTKDGLQSLIYLLVDGDLPRVKTLVCQSGSASDAIREFIQNLVRDKMPTPCK